jgi:hypothetical protein
MPVYIICSTDRSDLGYIRGLNLCPYFSTTSSTIQVQSLNTQANFQILTVEDYIDFDIIEEEGEAAFLCHLSMGDQQGLAYDSLPALINTYIVRSGQLFTSMFNTLHKVVFIHKKLFQISDMSYNFKILLGYTGVQFPIQSHDKTMWVQRKSTEAQGPAIESVKWLFPLNPQFPNWDYNQYQFFTCCSPDRYIFIPLPVIVSPADCWDYRVSYELQFNELNQPWCSVLESSGTVTVNKDLSGDAAIAERNVTVTARIYEGKADTPSFIIRTGIACWERNTKRPILYHYTALNGKPRLLFGEAARYSLVGSNRAGNDGAEYRVKKEGWTIDNVDVCSFYGTRTDKSKEVEQNSCLIIAGYTTGKATLSCGVEYYHEITITTHEWIDDGIRTFEIEVLNDQLTVIRQEIEPAMVGSGLSTTELYLLSNCGTQSYRNSLEDGETLMPAQVSAVISNAFSPSFPVQTSSDIIARIPTASLSNLWFRLVDANFVPIKLLNPLYLTLSVNPAAGESEDLTPFAGKLPKDKPTPEQAQKIQEQQAMEAQAAEEQKQTSGIIQEVISGLVQQYKDLKAQEAQQQAMAEAQEQQQEALAQQELLNQGYTPEQLQAAMPPAPPPPPPTQEEIQAAEQQQAEAERQETISHQKEVLELAPERLS